MTAAIPRLGSVVLDCPDPTALADFYARLLDWPIARSDEDWVSLAGPAGILIEFQRAPDYRPPTWPDPERPQMLHLDLTVDDLDAAHDRALGLGARLLDTQESFRVYADPADHPFCLCAC